MRVKLRGNYRLVPKQFLDVAQVNPAIEQVRGEGMAQRVSVDASKLSTFRNTLNLIPNGVRAEGASLTIAEDESLCALCKVRAKGSSSFAPEKRDALFITLAEHADLACVEIHILDSHQTDFFTPAAGRVKQFGQRAFAWRDSGAKESLYFLLGEITRQTLTDFGAPQERRGRKPNCAGKHEKSEKLPHGHDAKPHCVWAYLAKMTHKET